MKPIGRFSLIPIGRGDFGAAIVRGADAVRGTGRVNAFGGAGGRENGLAMAGDRTNGLAVGCSPISPSYGLTPARFQAQSSPDVCPAAARTYDAAAARPRAAKRGRPPTPSTYAQPSTH